MTHCIDNCTWGKVVPAAACNIRSIHSIHSTCLDSLQINSAAALLVCVQFSFADSAGSSLPKVESLTLQCWFLILRCYQLLGGSLKFLIMSSSCSKHLYPAEVMVVDVVMDEIFNFHFPIELV